MIIGKRGAYRLPVFLRCMAESDSVSAYACNTGLVGEEVGRAAEGIESEMVAHHGGEAVEALAHVAGPQRDADLEVVVEGEQGGGPKARWRDRSASFAAAPRCMPRRSDT